jgi:O-methyltransferase/aklanonic acid methyltransferase
VTEAPEDVKARIAGGFGRAAMTYDTVIPFFETFAEYLVEAAAPQPGERVLDIACGRGACLRVAARRVGPSGYVLGVDLSSGMIELLRCDLGTLDLPPETVEVRVGDGERLDIPNDSFDLVVCGFGVFFFPDPGAAFAELGRVLRGGGRIAVSTFVGSGGGYPWLADVIREVRPATTMPPPSPVATETGLIEFLHCSGFVDATSRQVEARFTFTDVDSYIAWNWSTGARPFLKSLNDGETEAYRDASANRLEQHAVPGGYELVQTVALTVATKPHTSATE